MKKTIIKLAFYAAAVLTLGISMVSCKDEPDKFVLADGIPTVYYVRPMRAAAADSLLTSAYMGSGICIVGDNLRSVYKLKFNDQEAVLNNSYITDHTLLVEVPNEIPGEVSNTMYLITQKADTVKYDFQVLVPAPVIYSMSNEHAKAGSMAYILGDYFVDDPNVPLKLFIGETEVPLKNITYNRLDFVVPDVPEGELKVTNIYGKTTSVFHYKDTRGMLFNFDTDPHYTNHGWHNQVIETDETALDGNFLRLGGADVTMKEGGDWNDSNFSFEYWPGDWKNPETYESGQRLTDYADFSNWKKMALKFELYVPKSNPWMAGSMQLIVGGVTKISTGAKDVVDIDGNILPGCNNTYFNNKELPRGMFVPWLATGSYDTDDEWVTVTLPYADFLYGSDGKPASGTLTESDFTSLTIFVWSAATDADKEIPGLYQGGTECNPIIKIDNIRAVPNK